MNEEYPRRNLGRGESWGYTVERRIDNLKRKQKTLQQTVGGINRYSAASAEDLIRAADRTRELADDIEDALKVLPRYFARSEARTDFGVPGDWYPVLQISVSPPSGFSRCEVSANATAYTVQPPATTGNLFDWPFPLSSVTSEYGPRPPLPFHAGIDFGQATGTPIVAAADGMISLRGYYDDWGHYTRIDHSAITGISGCWTGYAHMVSSPLYPPGTWVTKGQVIGYVGNTGYSTGPHLHFETATDNTRGNPRDFMAIWEGGSSTSYQPVEGRIVINGVASPTFQPYSEVGLGPNQMTFPIFGRSLPATENLTVSLDLRVPYWYSPASPSNRATLSIQGGYS